MPKIGLFPPPKRVREFPGGFDLSQEMLISVSPKISQEALDMIRRLQAIMREAIDLPCEEAYIKGQIEPKVNKEHLDGTGYTIMVSGKKGAPEPQNNNWSGDIPPELKGQAYLLRISREAVLIEAPGYEGLSYSLTTLKQIIASRSNDFSIPSLEIIDYPSFPLRAQYLNLRDADPYLLREKISAYILPHKFNFLYLEVAPRYIEFKSHPEFKTDYSIPQRQMKDIVSFCRSHHLEVVPLFNFLGHQVEGGLLEIYPEFAEDKNKPWAYCPNNPQVYKIAFDLIDEVLDIFNPKYFHLGHDEVVMGPYGKSQIGSCPKCKGKNPPQIFADDIMKYYRHLKEKGIQTMIWGDQFLNPPDFPGADGSMYGTVNYPALDLLPRDIIICDWHYGVKETYPTTKFFIEKGFKVICATGVYYFENIEHFSEYAGGLVGKGVVGMMNTFWGKVKLPEDDTPGRDNQGALPSYLTDYNVVAKIKCAAQCFWKGGK